MFKRAFDAEAAETIAEAEATLTGRLLERHGWREDLPGWVVVNALAHGDWEWLSTVAEGASTGHDRLRDAVVTFLAGETLAVAGSAPGLAQLQRAYLVPLELTLLQAGEAAPLSPAAIVTAVRGQLARARSRQRHPSAPVDE